MLLVFQSNYIDSVIENQHDSYLYDSKEVILKPCINLMKHPICV